MEQNKLLLTLAIIHFLVKSISGVWPCVNPSFVTILAFPLNSSRKRWVQSSKLSYKICQRLPAPLIWRRGSDPVQEGVEELVTTGIPMVSRPVQPMKVIPQVRNRGKIVSFEESPFDEGFPDFPNSHQFPPLGNQYPYGAQIFQPYPYNGYRPPFGFDPLGQQNLNSHNIFQGSNDLSFRRPFENTLGSSLTTGFAGISEPFGNSFRSPLRDPPPSFLSSGRTGISEDFMSQMILILLAFVGGLGLGLGPFLLLRMASTALSSILDPLTALLSIGLQMMRPSSMVGMSMSSMSPMMTTPSSTTTTQMSIIIGGR